MIRVVKRYGGGSRKLYDTEESRYVSLAEIAEWIRRGQQLRIVDSRTSEDVTAQTLAQVISEGGKGGGVFLSGDFLHEIIRRSGQAVGTRVRQVQTRVDRLVSGLPPARRTRGDLERLRRSLRDLEHSLSELEARPPAPRGQARKRAVG